MLLALSLLCRSLDSTDPQKQSWSLSRWRSKAAIDYDRLLWTKNQHSWTTTCEVTFSHICLRNFVCLILRFDFRTLPSFAGFVVVSSGLLLSSQSFGVSGWHGPSLTAIWAIALITRPAMHWPRRSFNRLGMFNNAFRWQSSNYPPLHPLQISFILVIYTRLGKSTAWATKAVGLKMRYNLHSTSSFLFLIKS